MNDAILVGNDLRISRRQIVTPGMQNGIEQFRTMTTIYIIEEKSHDAQGAESWREIYRCESYIYEDGFREQLSQESRQLNVGIVLKLLGKLYNYSENKVNKDHLQNANVKIENLKKQNGELLSELENLINVLRNFMKQFE